MDYSANGYANFKSWNPTKWAQRLEYHKVNVIIITSPLVTITPRIYYHYTHRAKAIQNMLAVEMFFIELFFLNTKSLASVPWFQ